MEFTYNRISVELYDGQDGPPHDVIERKNGEVWMVPHNPVALDQHIDWRHHKREDFVYVPLYPYLLPIEPDLAFGFMLQLGIRVATDLQKPALRFHLALGNPVNSVFQDGTGNFWQYQVGMAIRIK